MRQRRVLGRPAMLTHGISFQQSISARRSLPNDAEKPLYSMLREWALGSLRGVLPPERLYPSLAQLEKEEAKHVWHTVLPRRRPEKSKHDLATFDASIRHDQSAVDASSLLQSHIDRARMIRTRTRLEWNKEQLALDTSDIDRAIMEHQAGRQRSHKSVDASSEAIVRGRYLPTA